MTASAPLGGAVSLQALATAVATAAHGVPFARVTGAVAGVSAQAIDVSGLSPFVHVGWHVEVATRTGPVLAEVIRMDRGTVLAKPLNEHAVIALHDRAAPIGPPCLWPHDSWKGRLVNGIGRPIDAGPPLVRGDRRLSILQKAPKALSRRPVARPLSTGVKAIDVFAPLCFGQRVGIFSGSGVGKSTLLSMLARSRGFDTVVVSLVGERGREVREFVEETLGEMVRRAVVVVATGDESAMMRRLASPCAMTVAEYFRARGDEVLLIMDSVTRYAHACRDMGLAAGEPPVARGYPPSVFSELPRLLERAGPGETGEGSITGVFAVLVDGDDHNDPVADAIRGLLDGHIVLDRAIAGQGRYPAIDILASISRLAERAWTADQRSAVVGLRRLVARFEESRDLRSIGGYQPGADAELDRAVRIVPKLYDALNQRLSDPPCEDAFRAIADCLAA
jgi:flagellum-specific ATP synthase